MSASERQTSRSKALLSLAVVLTAALVFGVLVSGLMRRSAGTRGTAPLLVYCAASLKTPMEKIAADYERESGTRVELSFGGSQTLLANIDVAKRGDLYLPADDSYIALARNKKLGGECFSIAEQTAVLAVPKGNPKQIRALTDLTRAGTRLSQANPDAAAIGKLVREATSNSGVWSALSNRTVVFKPTVVDAANDVKLGAVDAALVWDSMAGQYPDLEFVRVRELASVRAKVVVAVLQCSAQPEAALKLARYIAAPEKGRKHFEQSGFTPSSP